MDSTDVRTTWAAALAKLTALVPSRHAHPKDPAYALEYLTLIHARKFMASGAPHLLVVQTLPGTDQDTISAALDKQSFNRIPFVTDRAMPAGETSGTKDHVVTPEEFTRLVENDKVIGTSQSLGERYGLLKADLPPETRDAYVIGEHCLAVLGKAQAEGLALDSSRVLQVLLLPPTFEVWLQALRKLQETNGFAQAELDRLLAEGLDHLERTANSFAVFPRFVCLVSDDPLRIEALLNKLWNAKHEDICYALNDEEEPQFAVTKDYAHQCGLLHPVACVYVFNSKGELLLQQRVNNSNWDHSAAGHLAIGETTMEGAAREMFEELTEQSTLVAHGTYLPSPPIANANRHLFHCFSTTHEGPFKGAPREVAALEWMTLRDLEAAFEQKDNFSRGFRATYAWLKAKLHWKT
jgi:isopentenyl-diphosphate delta-isomerase